MNENEIIQITNRNVMEKNKTNRNTSMTRKKKKTLQINKINENTKKYDNFINNENSNQFSKQVVRQLGRGMRGSR